MESCIRFLEGTMKLKVNREKSKIGDPMELKYLGFRLAKRKNGTVCIIPHEKSIKRFKDRIREMLRINRGDNVKVITAELRRYEKGWFYYFGIGPNESFFDELDGWVRRRVRALLLKQWKTSKNRQKQIRRISHVGLKTKTWERIRAISFRNHIWRASADPAINSTLTNSKLQEETNMYYMTDDWEKVQARFLRSPLPNGTMGSGGGRQSTLSDFFKVL